MLSILYDDVLPLKMARVLALQDLELGHVELNELVVQCSWDPASRRLPTG